MPISIKVADAIMGTGKTSAIINYINEHPKEHYVYITPYLSEAHRIKQHCPAARFVEPSNRLRQFAFKKLTHTASLIQQGRNIASTHQAFKHYTPEMLQQIKEKGYTLFIDENVDVLELLDIDPDDINIAVAAGYVRVVDGVYELTNEAYRGRLFADLFGILKAHKVQRITDHDDNAFFYWSLPPDLITAFKDVFICTYMFEGQSLHHLLKMYNLPYQPIGIEKNEKGEFRFGEYPGYIPKYTKELKKKIHILESDKLNEVGDSYYALSMNWFTKHDESVEQLRKNINNYYRNINPDTAANKRLWGAFNSTENALKGKGYSKSFLTFNARATNEYSGCDCLVYVVNIFQNVIEKTFYQQHGVEIDDDMYALSIMVQWIWRSAIRDGKEINLYIPSRRMRTLLTNWIDSLTENTEE